MSRRKQSVLEDLVVVTAKFPWWVGLIFAAVAYLAFHHYASIEISAPIGAKDIGASAGMQIVKIGATFGQYLLPIAFLIGSIASVLGRRKRNALHSSVATNASALDEMSWQEFELLIGEFFRRRGFAVEETGGGGADGGVDLIVSHGTDRYMVQCKQWKARQVGVTVVRELYGVMAAQGAAGGFVVTSGAFTDDAKRFAEGREIELVPCDQLLAMIREQRRDLVKEKATAAAAAAFPSCPQCRSPMVMRTARKGAQPGSSFWGCSTYPKCRGTRPV